VNEQTEKGLNINTEFMIVFIHLRNT